MKKLLAIFTFPLLSLVMGTSLAVAQGDTLDVGIELGIKSLDPHSSVYCGNAYFE